MGKNKSIQLTDDPLTNIHIMTPMLDEKGRKEISCLMYGYYLASENGKERETMNKRTG